MTGTIAKILHGKGYGFIKDEDGHRRFFHIRDLVENDGQTWLGLREGMMVEFEPIKRSEPTSANNGLGVSKVVICE